MIEIVNDNIFDTKTTAYINPVNCVGVMGAGLAKQMADKYPEACVPYFKRCKSLYNLMKPGVLITAVTDKEQPKYIIHFPTKIHWKKPSRAEFILLGLDALHTLCLRMNFESISIPKIGCGLGGLDWEQIKPTIIDKLQNLDTKIVLCEYDE